MDSQDGDWRDRSSAWDNSAWDNQAGRFSAIRVALLFGSVAIAIAMLVVPILQSGARDMSFSNRGAGVDTMATGSIRDGGNRYTIRRSVLQPSPDAVCVIRENGVRNGDC